MEPKNRTKTVVMLGVTVACLVGLAFLNPMGMASHQPANKTAVAAGSIEILHSELLDPQPVVTLMSQEIRTSNPQDLVFRVTMECALWTEVSVLGSGESTSEARVTVWVEFDGQPVTMGSQDPDGKVVFCDRLHQFRVTTGDPDQEIEHFLATRTANAFNWILLDAGKGIHTVEVKAQLEAWDTGLGNTNAGIGKRTMMVEPIQAVNDATL